MTADERTVCMHCGEEPLPGSGLVCAFCRRPVSPRAEALLSDPELQAAVQRAFAQAMYESSQRRIDWGGFALGVTIALVALAISLGTYDSASKGGGTYVVFWGAVLWGGWKALKSLAG
ncbi:MAG: hypothetical protein WCK58_17710 [Chloroflexota bacterium]